MEAGFFKYNDVLQNPIVQARLARAKAERDQQKAQQRSQSSGSDSLPPLSPTSSWNTVQTQSNNNNSNYSTTTTPIKSPHQQQSYFSTRHQQRPVTSGGVGADGVSSSATTTMDGSFAAVAYAASNAQIQAAARYTLSKQLSMSSSSDGTNSSREIDNSDLLANPYELRHGRRFLRDMPYPLPCDLAEMHRQSLRTLLGVTAFAKAACAPAVEIQPPKKVLEVGCGSAYWSSCCHEYFTSLGAGHVSFIGVDIAPVAPSLRKQGVDWKFVQHDLRRMPWPFREGEFDYVMIKDMSLAVPLGKPSQNFMTECIRVLGEGGTLEIWESDHVLRCLLPNPPLPPGVTAQDEQTANETRTFLTTPGTPFAAAQNRYIRHWNAWAEAALTKRNLPPAPCARIAETLFQEPESLCSIGFKRVAIPFRQLPWEKEKPGSRKHSRAGIDGKASSRPRSVILNADQAAIRHTAFLTFLSKVESLEPILKEASGKNTEEWAHWWANMMSDLIDEGGATGGEALEIGAWWATKRTII